MKLTILACLLAMTIANAMPPEQAAEIRAKVAAISRAELPILVFQLVRNAPPADRETVKATALAAVRDKHPAALKVVLKVLDEPIAINRPPTTPGNVNGQRPEVPPGEEKRNYGEP